MAMQRRSQLRAMAAAALMVTMGRHARAQELRSARILVGVPAGAPGDLLARGVADKLRHRYAASCTVENLPGASTQLAIAAAVRSASDGSTLLLTPSSPLSVFPFTHAKLPYQPATDLVPVTLAGYFNHAFAVGPAVPVRVNTLKGYLEWAKANPESATYGTSGTGTIPHLLCAAMARRAGVPLTNVPYRGSTQGLTDLLGGRISAMSSPVGNFLTHLAEGRVRLLAVSGDARSRLAPDVPTYKEQGVPLVAREWLGFFLPGGATAAARQAAGAVLIEALALPELAAGMGRVGIEVESSSAESLAAMLHADAQEWQRVVREIGYRAEP